MLAFLALAIAQSSLPSDPHDAAMTCTRVVASHITTDDPMIGTAQLSYFLLQAARAQTAAGGSLFAAMNVVKGEMKSSKPLDPAEARSLLPACDARFPKARQTGAVALPPAEFDRTLICVMQLSIMSGGADAQREATGDRIALDRYSAALRVYLGREDAALKKAGYANETAASAPLEKAIIAGLDIGNPYVLADACIKAQ